MFILEHHTHVYYAQVVPMHVWWSVLGVRLSSTTTPKIQDKFVLWVVLRANGLIPIRHLLQQQDPKENSFYKWVSRGEDVHIWVVPLRQPKIGLPYRYSVGGWFWISCYPFWVWVPKWDSLFGYVVGNPFAERILFWVLLLEKTSNGYRTFWL